MTSGRDDPVASPVAAGAADAEEDGAGHPTALGPEADGIAVTVLVMTYNHERYIRRALDGALGQELTVPYEVLISEDCSTDGTREIVEAYARRHPDRIRLVLSPANLRSNEVVARGFRAARGRYLALLDGDDFWTAEDKLQAQFDFL